MTVTQIPLSFNSISHRILYTLNLIYSEFTPIDSSDISKHTQKELHGLMGQMIDKLYENPKLLNLSSDKDEAYQSWEVNNMKPALDKIYVSVFKSLFDLYKFLYFVSLYGKINGTEMSIENTILKDKKSNYKVQYKALLSEIGVNIEKTKTEIVVTAESAILNSLKLLAEKTPTNINKWTPFSLANFACCSFSGSFDYLLDRVNNVVGMDSLLFDLDKRCIEKGYEKSIKCNITASYIDFSITYKNKIGGFHMGYNSRKYTPFSFGTLNGIGEKSMIENFHVLDIDLQKHFIDICKTCNNCLICTKAGKNKIFAININFEGKEYNLCPSFPRHCWDKYTPELVDVLFKYHDEQEKYGTDWKKKR
jgi:hypothetical protein